MPDPDPASMIIFSVVLPLIFNFLLLLLTALFSMCDDAFFAVGETRIRELEDDGSRKAAKVRKLMAKERQFTTRVRINTLFCVVIAVIHFTQFTSIFTNLLMPVFGSVMGYTFTALVAYILLFVLAFLLFGTFGVLLPRRLAHLKPEALS